MYGGRSGGGGALRGDIFQRTAAGGPGTDGRRRRGARAPPALDEPPRGAVEHPVEPPVAPATDRAWRTVLTRLLLYTPIKVCFGPPVPGRGPSGVPDICGGGGWGRCSIFGAGAGGSGVFGGGFGARLPARQCRAPAARPQSETPRRFPSLGFPLGGVFPWAGFFLLLPTRKVSLVMKLFPWCPGGGKNGISSSAPRE